MSDKYIIRNCNVLYFNPDKTAICNDLMIECPCYCKDCTDCILKQIVEKCKAEINLRPDANIDDDFAKEILELLDIEECE